jgi:hypothetical protein
MQVRLLRHSHVERGVEFSANRDRPDRSVLIGQCQSFIASHRNLPAGMAAPRMFDPQSRLSKHHQTRVRVGQIVPSHQTELNGGNSDNMRHIMAVAVHNSVNHEASAMDPPKQPSSSILRRALHAAIPWSAEQRPQNPKAHRGVLPPIRRLPGRMASQIPGISLLTPSRPSVSRIWGSCTVMTWVRDLGEEESEHELESVVETSSPSHCMRRCCPLFRSPASRPNPAVLSVFAAMHIHAAPARMELPRFSVHHTSKLYHSLRVFASPISTNVSPALEGLYMIREVCFLGADVNVGFVGSAKSGVAFRRVLGTARFVNATLAHN